MAMPISQKQIDPGADVYYDPAFRRVMETHLGLLRNMPETRVVAIENNLAYKYEHDFYGLLQAKEVPEYLHWVILRVNDMVDPRDFQSSMNQFLYPPAEVIDNIRRIYATTVKKL